MRKLAVCAFISIIFAGGPVAAQNWDGIKIQVSLGEGSRLTREGGEPRKPRIKPKPKPKSPPHKPKGKAKPPFRQPRKSDPEEGSPSGYEEEPGESSDDEEAGSSGQDRRDRDYNDPEGGSPNHRGPR